MYRTVFEEFAGIREDNFSTKAVRDVNSNLYRVYMKYNEEWLFSGSYTKGELVKVWPNCIIN